MNKKIITTYKCSVSPICILRRPLPPPPQKKKYNRCQSMPLIGGPLCGPPINGMDQAVLDQEGDMNTFNNRIYRITAHNFI